MFLQGSLLSGLAAGAAPISVLLLSISFAKSACMDPEKLTHSVVGITRHFSKAERQNDPTLLGIRGTAWFLSRESMATASHVAQSMGLLERDWSEVEIADGPRLESLPIRVQKVAGQEAEKIAVLALSRPYSGARPLQIGTEPLSAGVSVISLGYPRSHPRFATGQFVSYGAGGNHAGSVLFELFDGNDRLALDHGASGAPVLDCDGRVVAMVSTIFTRTISFMAQPIRVSTPWGSANVAAIPASSLADLSDAGGAGQ